MGDGLFARGALLPGFLFLSCVCVRVEGLCRRALCMVMGRRMRKGA
jgi:hypothetical protein